MPRDYKEILMHNIAYLRRHHHLSKTEMAVLLHVGLGTITKLEQGVFPPNLPAAVLLHIHVHFGIDPDSQLDCRLDEEGAPPSRLYRL